MDKWQAQATFWSSFGVPAYEENSVPDLNRVSFPYITYQSVSGPFGADQLVTASVWTEDYSWARANAISDAIEERLKHGGETVRYEGGGLWITAEDNFSQSMGDPDDDRIKRKLISVVLHFA